MKNSKVSWTKHTFNIWWGCVHAPADDPTDPAMVDMTSTSEECANCYAEATDRRYGGDHWGAHAPRRFFGEAYWRKPLEWNAAAEAAGERHRVFCSSMADVFEVHADHPTNVVMSSYRIALWDLIRRTPSLDWLLLTKRAENLARMLPWMVMPHHATVLGIGAEQAAELSKPWPNVWVGVTAGTRRSLWRIRKLREVRAVRRFVSCEPLLEHITARDWDRAIDPYPTTVADFMVPALHPIDLLIVGDESGAHRRPAQVDWIRTAREAALRHGVTFHLKQWAGADVAGIGGVRKGPGGKIHLPVLDGRQWSDMPTSPLSADSADKVAEIMHAHGLDAES